MSAIGIETQNTLYLFSDGQYQRRPLAAKGRSRAEQLNTILAGGALDDEVWLPMLDLHFQEHPSFPGELGLRIITGPGPFDYVQTTPVKDDDAARDLVEGRLWEAA